MTKVLGAMICYYGAEYLPYAIRSMYDLVDSIAIFYTNSPSFGHRTDVVCPESESQLRSIALSVDPYNKIKWFSSKGYRNEGEHRVSYEAYAKTEGFDIVVITDTDEVWDGDSLSNAVSFVSNSQFQRYMVPMVHLWQDYDAICYDPCQPVRIYKATGRELGYAPLTIPTWHFGYCVDDNLMAFKWSGIHGHQPELRRDWFSQKWMARAMTDIHPTNVNFWNAVQYDKELMPAFMRDSPRWSLKRLKEW